MYWNGVRVRVRVFKAIFNNISVISWQSVLLVEETRENHRPVTCLIKGGNLSFNSTFLLQKRWPYKRGTTVILNHRHPSLYTTPCWHPNKVPYRIDGHSERGLFYINIEELWLFKVIGLILLNLQRFQTRGSLRHRKGICTLLRHKLKNCLLLLPEQKSGMIIFSYLTDFSYFPLQNKFRMLQDMIWTSQKWRFWKGV